MTSAIHRGRGDLRSWRDDRPTNAFDDDPDLQRALRTRLAPDAYAAVVNDLRAAGADAAGPLGELARINNREENLPRLQRFDEVGTRIERVEFHPAYHEAGRLVWKSGVLGRYEAPGHELEQMALTYMFGQHGEFGHACPLACTAGLIKLLQAVGSEDQQARWLPGLLSRDYDRRIHASQFLTEVQGGSDVGANAVVARPADDGSYRIHGEKWFCSVIDAQVFLMTARIEGAASGTRGLSLFLVPRQVDGRTNDFRIRRLKWKLGTRAMASAETDFEGAYAEAIGPVDRGFKNVVERVLDTSRVFNAVVCAGSMRRAYVEAASYARHRRAFGQPIGRFGLVQEAVATLRAEAMAALSASMRITAQSDRIARGDTDAGLIASRRMAVNLNKYWTSVRNTQMVRTAMEVLGGNGAIESFSVLPQLYRDAMVLESWEGTHNTLVAQVMRDTARLGLHVPFVESLRSALDALSLPADDDALRAEVRAGVDALEAPLERIAADEADQRWARRVVDQMATAHAMVSLLEELAVHPEDDACRGAVRLLTRRDLRVEVPPPDALPPALFDSVARSL